MTSAAAVSAALRRGGLNPLGSGSSRMREGIRVTASGDRVRVVADLDSDRAAKALAEDAALALSADGYDVEIVSGDPAALYVSR